MNCPYCKEKNNNDALFCRYCGKDMRQSNTMQNKAIRGDYVVSIVDGLFNIRGKYYHFYGDELIDVEGEESVPVEQFLGIGYTRCFSKKKCFRALGAGGAMILVKNLIVWLIKIINKTNVALKLPEWMYVIYIALILISFGFAVSYFLSKKDIIEISFKGAWIAVPQSSMTEVEVVELRDAIIKAKEGK